MIPTTASALFLKQKSKMILSFGSQMMDFATGGVPSGGITELTGEAGCGKTQICLSLALQVQLDEKHGGLNGSAAYICGGEGLFPIKRLAQLAKHFESKTGKLANELLSAIHIEQSYNIDDVLDMLTNRIPEMCRENGVRLLVIDSLAGLLRTEFDSRSVKEMSQRTAVLFRLATKLKWLSDIYSLCVVVVNQATAGPVFGTSEGASDGGIPAMGMAWAHCINSRIVLRKVVGRCCIAGSEEEEEYVEKKVDATLVAPTTAQTVNSDMVIGDSYFLNPGGEEEQSCGLAKWSPRRLHDVVEYHNALSSAESEGDGAARRMLLVLSPSRPSGSCLYKITSSGLVGFE